MEDPLLWNHREWKTAGDPRTREQYEKDKKKILVVIPARMASNRLPGKPLLMAGGQALVHWTYCQAKQTYADHVVVATPDREIARYCEANDLVWMATAEGHPNGTSRCHEIVVRAKVNFDIVVNWQVDEPCVQAKDVDKLIDAVTLFPITTYTLVCHEKLSSEQLFDANLTKVACSHGRCFWFSRAPMRGAYGHVGIYGFRSSVLSELVGGKHVSLNAEAESLEQLAWIEQGYKIRCRTIEEIPLSVNTPEDWEKFKKHVED